MQLPGTRYQAVDGTRNPSRPHLLHRLRHCGAEQQRLAVAGQEACSRDGRGAQGQQQCSAGPISMFSGINRIPMSTSPH